MTIRTDDLTPAELAVANTFFRAIAPTQCLSARISAGEYVLTITHGAHRQQVRHASLLHAMALALRVHQALIIDPATEAA